MRHDANMVAVSEPEDEIHESLIDPRFGIGKPTVGIGFVQSRMTRMCMKTRPFPRTSGNDELISGGAVRTPGFDSGWTLTFSRPFSNSPTFSLSW